MRAVSTHLLVDSVDPPVVCGSTGNDPVDRNELQKREWAVVRAVFWSRREEAGSNAQR